MSARLWFRSTVFCLALCAISTAAWAQYHWSQVKVNGAFDTYALSTNDTGWLVGSWFGRDGNPANGAFRFMAKQFIDFRIPGAEATAPTGIGKASWIVGQYTLGCGCPEGSATAHGFLYQHNQGGQITTLAVPHERHILTLPAAINDLGQVVGSWYRDHDDNNGDVQQGHFLYEAATQSYQEIAVPPDFYMEITGINNHGDLSGYIAFDTGNVLEPIVFRGLVRWKGAWYTLHVPDALHTLAYGLNDQGEIVGESVTPGPAFWHTGWKYDVDTAAWEIFPSPKGIEERDLRVQDIDNLGRMVAIETRRSDGYTMSYWIRPKAQVSMAAK